jgi:hypothetical protein
MRTRGRSWGALPAAVCFLVLAAGSASAGFESGIVVVRATAADIPHVSACTDGDRGALVVWQENTGGSAGPLRAAHVLASGEIDDAWPAEGAPRSARSRTMRAAPSCGGSTAAFSARPT